MTNTIISFLGLVWFTVLLSACGERAPYPIKDSGFPAKDGTNVRVYWLDNDRVIFTGYKVDEYLDYEKIGEGRFPKKAIFIWDTRNNKITKYAEGDLTCFFRNYIRYAEHRGDGSIYFYKGDLGREKAFASRKSLNTETEYLSGQVEPRVNLLTCQPDLPKPEWVKGPRVTELLPEHGYLDFGKDDWIVDDANPILFYASGALVGKPILIGSHEVWKNVTFAPFAEAYLIKGFRETPGPAPVWQISKDGELKQSPQVPKHKYFESFFQYYLVKNGAFVTTSTNAKFNLAGDSGGYLIHKDGSVKKVIAGLVEATAISPDGCKVAVINVLHGQARADSMNALGAGKSGSQTLKMIDLCKGVNSK